MVGEAAVLDVEGAVVVRDGAPRLRDGDARCMLGRPSSLHPLETLEVTMPTQMWLNLPVADLERSRAFFERIGFDVDSHPEQDDILAVRAGETRAMLVTRDRFAQYASTPASDPTAATGAEVLISFDAASREEVDELATRVEEAGGTVFGRPGGQGGMYGMGFIDPDGHRWNALFMDDWAGKDA